MFARYWALPNNQLLRYQWIIWKWNEPSLENKSALGPFYHKNIFDIHRTFKNAFYDKIDLAISYTRDKVKVALIHSTMSKYFILYNETFLSTTWHFSHLTLYSRRLKLTLVRNSNLQGPVDQNYFHPQRNFPSLRKQKYSLTNKFSETLLAQTQWENLTMNILFIIYLFALSLFATCLTGILFISGVRWI